MDQSDSSMHSKSSDKSKKPSYSNVL